MIINGGAQTIKNNPLDYIKNMKQLGDINRIKQNVLPSDKRLSTKNDLFNGFNSINTLSEDTLGIAGYPLIVRNKNGEYIYKILLDDTNNVNDKNTYSYYEYNILKMLNSINEKNPKLQLPIIKVYDYKRMKEETIINLLSQSKLQNKEKVLNKLVEVFKKKETSNKLMGIYRMDKVQGIPIADLLKNMMSNDLLKVLFEQFYVLLQIKKIYPKFVHNDLHLYNLLLVKSNNPQLKTLTLNNISYKIHNVLYTPYMIDFDQSLIDGITNKKSMEQLKDRDNNFDEYYITLQIVIDLFDSLMEYIQTDINLSTLRKRYINLKKNGSKLYQGYEIMIYIYLFNLFNDYLYDEERKMYMNKKNIQSDVIDNILEFYNSINKCYNIFIMILSNSLTTHHVQFMYSKKVDSSLVKIIKRYNNKSIELYQYIYKVNEVPSFLLLPNELNTYINTNNQLPYLNNNKLLEKVFSKIIVK